MKLKQLQFKTFSQGADIKADIGNGWCAGITGLVSIAAGVRDEEANESFQEWAVAAYGRIGNLLDDIAGKKKIVEAAEGLQIMLRKVADEDNIVGSLHAKEYDGRGCKVLLSTVAWFPVLGYVSYLWKWDWSTNHVGYIARGGKRLIVFDPNYGVGLYSIDDDKPLTIDEVTTVVRELAWSRSAASYYLSNVSAMAVIDEDALRIRPSVATLDKVQRLLEESKKFYV